MLKTLRKKGVAKKVLWFTAIIIILSFGVFGTANYYQGGNESSHAGRIFGKKITFDEFQESFLHARNQAILRYGDNFDKIAPMLDLDSEAWDRLILLQEAKKRRIKVLDEEVVDTIEDFEFFKQKGRFDPVIYNKIVRYVFRCEPREFEEGVRESLIFSKLFEQETSNAEISEEQALQEYQRKNEQAQVSFIMLSADSFQKDAVVTAEEAKEFYEQNKDDFRLPPSINIQFITIATPKNPEPASAETEPKPSQTTDDIQALLKNISDEAQKTRDLEAIAKKFNLSIQETGFISMESTFVKSPLPFSVLQTAFDLPENQISVPLETPQGTHIIKVKEKKDSYIPLFDDASQKATEMLSAKKSRALARQKAEGYLSQMKETFKNDPNTDFTQLAKSLNLNAEQTPMFLRNQYLPTIGISKDFQESAFLLSKENPLSDIVETAKGFCIIHLDQYIPIDQEKYKKEKDNFFKELAVSKKNESFSQFVLSLRQKANLQDNIAKLRKEQQVNPE